MGGGGLGGPPQGRHPPRSLFSRAAFARVGASVREVEVGRVILEGPVDQLRQTDVVKKAYLGE